jgi:tetratricopeptide (TPR) repeat protein
MNAKGSPDVDKVERIKWFDALDGLATSARFEKALQIARECLHPDAQWLTSLLPAGSVTHQSLREVMQKQGDDPRALFIASELLDEDHDNTALIRRAADKGYAPAQALVLCESAGESFEWAQKAAAGGARRGLFRLAFCFLRGTGCARDKSKAIELLREAAELGHGDAEYWYGMTAFSKFRWERFYWMGRAAAHDGSVNQTFFYHDVADMRDDFEKGKFAQILHTVAAVVRAHFDRAESTISGRPLLKNELEVFRRIVELHDAMLRRARAAVMCWSAVGLRCGVVKDVRVMISKQLWAEAWRWSEKKAKKSESSKGGPIE